MSESFLGIDIGTQSTKALLLDSENGQVLGVQSAAYDLLPDLPPGHKEQHPADWVAAVRQTVKAVLEATGVERGQVRGIGVSGQQHGFVALDENDEVIRPAKLWCDTSTAPEADDLIKRLGGLERAIELIGNGVPPGFTASKILWLKQHEPDNYARLATVLLPHDYINFWLTGRKVMEPGDASGTALLDVRARRWSEAAINAIDPALTGKLPSLIESSAAVGVLRPELQQHWGLGPEVLVSAGGGDNMMSAIGTGNVRPGVVTASLGTSGTIYACSTQPVIDPQGEVAAFCDSTGRWLPLVCTMNVTVATEMVRQQFGWTHEQFEAAAASIPAGADGLLLVPFLEGERVPNCPDGTGLFFGVRPATFDPPHLARAALEGVTLGLNYGLERLRQLGLNPTEIRVTGGGAASALWRQIMADIFQVEVVAVEGEGAALGAAVHALWVYRNERGAKTDIGGLTDALVKTNEVTRARPDKNNSRRYSNLKPLFERLSLRREDFSAHRKFLLNAP